MRPPVEQTNSMNDDDKLVKNQSLVDPMKESLDDHSNVGLDDDSINMCEHPMDMDYQSVDAEDLELFEKRQGE